ncbi:putative Short-chain dehydrogenase/reductase SDR [Vibrio nigripulchritudo SOn1]|uniref:Short-chain dehydrogenase/reductase SDR n=1 Tax=Vibrio nigripulchritudo SOn1 TaxID=1238450 RepID=A0AAV2VUS6_9VIBR|nr:SDR family oxidoreductase [Vibrio nigripulchritudo]CCO48466.1 putative Short-chain dehydrogenase/reductase SDR [Vibrio nigripulchritudo SOn1]
MKEKKVLIIGGSSGIGLALARQVREQGAHVIIASRSATQKANKLRETKLLEDCEYFSVDITVESEIENLLEQTGNIDHIAITVKAPLNISPFIELNTQHVRQDFETKLWGQYNLAKLAYKRINPGGSIIFSSGTLGSRPYVGFSTMSIISGSIESLCKALALELAPIRVNVVCPGFKTLKEMEEKIPLGLGRDSQISNAYLFLMNDSYTTGTTIVSDGGATII